MKSQSQHTHTKCLLKPLESEGERVATSVSWVQRALQPAQSRGCVVSRLSTSPSQPLRVTVLYTDAARASQKVRERRRRGAGRPRAPERLCNVKARRPFGGVGHLTARQTHKEHGHCTDTATPYRELCNSLNQARHTFPAHTHTHKTHTWHGVFLQLLSLRHTQHQRERRGCYPPPVPTDPSHSNPSPFFSRTSQLRKKTLLFRSSCSLLR